LIEDALIQEFEGVIWFTQSQQKAGPYSKSSIIQAFKTIINGTMLQENISGHDFDKNVGKATKRSE